jgi:UDP-N-acetylglucosamine 3-dehydrogenase
MPVMTWKPVLCLSVTIAGDPRWPGVRGPGAHGGRQEGQGGTRMPGHHGGLDGMDRLRVAFIGTGRKPERAGPQGYGMAHQHAAAYHALPERCTIVACADIVPENARGFAEMWGLPADGVFTDAAEMLRRARPDVVSVCVWPHLHAPLVLQAALAGVRAIHCEKPMADSWGACRIMAQECARRGVLLTFNHQRRFGRPFRGAKRLLDDGVVGRLHRVEFGAGNLYDYGSHNFDLCGYFAGERPARWVMAQIDYRTENIVFGAHNENSAHALWAYDDGVLGVAATGVAAPLVGCHNRIVGTEGEIEIGPAGQGLPVLRWRRYDAPRGWEAVDCGGEGLHGPGYIERAIADVLDAVASGRPSELCARNALNATELIFGCWESVRRRGRVDLPLQVEDNALQAMVDEGALRPAPRMG